MTSPSTRNRFACGYGHHFEAFQLDNTPIDLADHFCPVCLGKIVDAQSMIDLRILAPVQE